MKRIDVLRMANGEGGGAAGAAAAVPPPVTDGRLQIITALEMTSDLVKLDLTTDPVTVVPDNLFMLRYNDPTVGITTADLVRVFKENLKDLLPTIADKLDDLPEEPAAQLEDVAMFVRLALL